MNKTQSFENFVYLVGLHIYYLLSLRRHISSRQISLFVMVVGENSLSLLTLIIFLFHSGCQIRKQHRKFYHYLVLIDIHVLFVVWVTREPEPKCFRIHRGLLPGHLSSH